MVVEHLGVGGAPLHLEITVHLISCDECGVVLDLDKLTVPNIFLEDGCIDTNVAMWDGEHHAPTVQCPVCNSKIML